MSSEPDISIDALIDDLEKVDADAIEKEITRLEAKIEKYRRLLSVRRGLKPKAKRGRRTKKAEAAAA